MDQTRRSFLKCSAGLLALLPLLGRSATAESKDAPSPAALGQRRGLLFDQADIPRIKANFESPRFAAVWKEINDVDFAKEAAFLEHELRFTNHVLHLARCRTLLENSALAYVLTKNPQHLTLARLALRKLGEFPKWDYFLEGGKSVIGIQRASDASMSTVYALDWLNSELTEEERRLAEKSLAEKGAPACFLTLYGMKHPDRVRGWTLDPEDEYPAKIDLARWPLILNSTNLKAIPIGGLGLSACWLMGKHPQAAQWLDLARTSAKSFATMYNSDGSYDEGMGYTSYATTHLALFAEVLWRTQGIDERNLINYPGVVKNLLAMSMPTLGASTSQSGPRNIFVTNEVIVPAYDIVNFGDSGISLDALVPSWVSHSQRDPLAQYFAANVGFYRSFLGAIWFDAALPASPPPGALLDVRMDNDRVISRSGWKAEDGVVALRSGGPSNHEHADRNSVIFKVYGERLFHDPFRAAYVATDPHWALRLTPAHTAVLIDGKGHQYHDGHEGTNSSSAWSRVLSFATGKDWMTVTSDAAEGYALVNENVTKVERTLVYLKPDLLLMFDRVELKTALPMQMRYQVYNDDGNGAASIQGKTFSITRPHAQLLGQPHSANELSLSVGYHDMKSAEVHPFVEVTSPPASSHAVLTVGAAAPTQRSPGTLEVKQSGSTWTVTGQHSGRAINVTIVAEPGAIPRVTV